MVYSDLSYAYKRLRDTLGPERVSRGEGEKFVYGHDFGPLPKQAGLQFALKPDLVALPKSTQEVVRVVELGSELQIPVVPRGGGTSLHGGAVPNVGGILLATTLLRGVEEPDPDHRVVTTQAGARWKDVERAAAAGDFMLPVVPIFHRSSSVGGFLSNGGVGIGSYKYGPPARWVRNLRVILPGGAVLETGQPGFHLGPQDYPLTSLFLGAEGTLGVIAEATLTVVPRPPHQSVLAYGFSSVAALQDALTQISRVSITPYHIGFVDGAHVVLQRALGKDLPDLAGIITLTFHGTKEVVQAEQAVAERGMTAAGGVKQEAEVAETLWEDRHNPYGARRLTGGLVAAEGLVPLARLDEVMATASELARRQKVEVAFHGFLVDRGAAYLAPYLLTNERWLRGQLALSYVEKYHRALTEAEGHPLGLGLLGTYNAVAMYGSVTRVMRAVKDAVDPQNLLNRGKLLGTMGRKPPLMPPELPPGLMRFGLRALGTLRRLMPAERYVTKIRRGR